MGGQPRSARTETVGWFTAWLCAAVGCCVAVIFHGAVAIPVGLGTALLVAGLLVSIRRSVVGLGGLIAGFSFPMFRIAYQHTQGAADSCTATAYGSTCIHRGVPWPWFLVGCLWVAGGIAVTFAQSRSSVHDLRSTAAFNADE